MEESANHLSSEQSVCPHSAMVSNLGFAHSRNKKSEEERSPSGLEEAEKKLSPPKKPLQQEKKQEENVCPSCNPDMAGTTACIDGELMSDYPPKTSRIDVCSSF